MRQWKDAMLGTTASSGGRGSCRAAKRQRALLCNRGSAGASPSQEPRPPNVNWRKLCRLSLLVLAVVFVGIPASGARADLIEFLSGAKVEGKVVAANDVYITAHVIYNNRKMVRKYPRSKLLAVTIGDKRHIINEARPKTSGGATRTPSRDTAPDSGAAPDDSTRRSRADIESLIARLGSTPPDWYAETPLDYPQSLDLSWPQPPPKGWNNQRNVGQYIWEIINPNPNRWKSGVRFMHHMLVVHKDNPRIRTRAMNSLGNMYHRLHQDYARAAFWWRKAGVEQNAKAYRNRVYLAECYWRLGSKPMAADLLTKTQGCLQGLKLWADMGETQKAIQIANAYHRSGYEDVAYLYAGDAYRVAQQFPKAITCYQKALEVPATGKQAKRIERYHARAREALEAVRLYEILDLARIADGTYRAQSAAYAGPLQVEVAVQGQRITSVRVTQHKEKQFFAAMIDTPRKIIEKQSVKGVDTTSSATITSEAIIHATAKALASGMK